MRPYVRAHLSTLRRIAAFSSHFSPAPPPFLLVYRDRGPSRPFLPPFLPPPRVLFSRPQVYKHLREPAKPQPRVHRGASPFLARCLCHRTPPAPAPAPAPAPGLPLYNLHWVASLCLRPSHHFLIHIGVCIYTSVCVYIHTRPNLPAQPAMYPCARSPSAHRSPRPRCQSVLSGLLRLRSPDATC